LLVGAIRPPSAALDTEKLNGDSTFGLRPKSRREAKDKKSNSGYAGGAGVSDTGQSRWKKSCR